uniref:Uncharacterized protein n=1 Tax=Amphimedon queenslandica TaxID=400682 RepID=A0A1X7UJU8_AMPQE
MDQELQETEKELLQKGRFTNITPTATIDEAARSRAKLPKLELKEFNTFWDLFDSAIHTNSSLFDIEIFTYLRTLLTKAAWNLLRTSPLCN